MNSFRFSIVISALLLILTGCGPTLAQRDELLVSYQYGNLPEAECRLNQTIQQEMPDGNYQRSQNATWLLLDRATVRFANGATIDAVEDYKTSIEALDYYNQDSPTETLAQFVLEDSVGAYQGAGFEQVLARVYFALALLQEGDLNNAGAILRQGEELQQQLRETYAKTFFMRDFILTDNALGKYLFAAILEKKGDFSNANILYKQSSDLAGYNLVPTRQSNSATVLIICHNGNVPRKVSETVDASVASAAVVEYLLAANGIRPAYSNLAGIPAPNLFQSLASQPVPVNSCLDGIQTPLQPIYDVSNTAYITLQQELPIIVARGVARLAIRRTAVAYAQEQDPCFGAILDIGMLIANAATQADIRAWSTLPSRIDLARYDISAGEHTVSINIGSQYPGAFSREVINQKIRLQPNDLCVINVFHIHPGVTTVLVPPQFLCP
jgi:hypothetical protein